MNLMIWPSGPSTPTDRPSHQDAWPGENAWAEALANDSVDQQAEQVTPAAAEVECPACYGEGCRACAGEGWVWATSDDDAALVAFRQAAAAFLHPSGFGGR